MAKCSNCGASVGCSCNLKGGLCAFCAEQASKQIKPETNVDTKTN